MTRTIARTGLAVAAVLACVGPATAGPIPWSYYGETGVGLTSFYSAHVSMGHESKTVIDPATGAGTVVEYNMIANIANLFEGSRTAPDRVRMLSVSPDNLGAYQLTDQWAVTRAGIFEARVTIADGASGASRELSWAAWGQSSGYFETGSFVVSLSVEDRTDTFVLGDNRYSVRADVQRSESADYLELDVNVSPALDAPEPGTMALAGLGLAAVGAARLRRWGSGTAPRPAR